MECFKEKFIGLDKVPKGIGAILKGWDIEEADYRNPDKLPVVDFRAMTAACPHDCFHCFTDKRKKTLTLDEIKNVIDQLAELNTYAIDFLGEGEPTIDRHFFEIIEYATARDIHSVIFTDAATKLRDRDNVRRLKSLKTTIVPKCDSLFNPEYQNWVVGDKKGVYFDERNEALKLIMEEGFNHGCDGGKTRMGFDMVVTRKNMQEVAETLRFCRNNNIWVIFTTFLPSGRSGKEDFDRSLCLTKEEENEVRRQVCEIDRNEYGFDHIGYKNFMTTRCIESFEIWGNGNVSPCSGNETIIGNIKESSVKALRDKLYQILPCHDPRNFDGHCLYR